MSSEEREDKTIYRVVVNHEEQYSIWAADRKNAPGWKDVGKSGTKEQCLSYIKKVWTDMRPRFLQSFAGRKTGERHIDASASHGRPRSRLWIDKQNAQ